MSAGHRSETEFCPGRRYPRSVAAGAEMLRNSSDAPEDDAGDGVDAAARESGVV